MRPRVPDTDADPDPPWGRSRDGVTELAAEACVAGFAAPVPPRAGARETTWSGARSAPRDVPGAVVGCGSAAGPGAVADDGDALAAPRATARETTGPGAAVFAPRSAAGAGRTASGADRTPDPDPDPAPAPDPDADPAPDRLGGAAPGRVRRELCGVSRTVPAPGSGSAPGSVGSARSSSGPPPL
ncbi:hypothetical protein AB1328_00985, partial [Streptomyces virginiae]